MTMCWFDNLRLSVALLLQIVVFLLAVSLLVGCGHVMPPPDFDFTKVKHNYARIYDLDEIDLTVNKADPLTVAKECYKIVNGVQRITGVLTLQMPPACAWTRADPNDPTYRPKCIIWHVYDYNLEHELNHCRGYPYKVPTFEETDRL